MVRYICFLCALLVIHTGHAKESGSETIRPYVEFLEQPHQTPVEYVMGLFDEAFMQVLKHRAILRGVSKEEVESPEWEDLIRSWGEVRLFPIWDNEAQRKVYEKLVNQWKYKQ